MNFVTKLASASIAVGLVVLGLKTAAYLLTGSVALYSDALENQCCHGDCGLWRSARSAMPPDANHPTVTKIEYLSAVIEGVLIVVAALAILRKPISA